MPALPGLGAVLAGFATPPQEFPTFVSVRRGNVTGGSYILPAFNAGDILIFIAITDGNRDPVESEPGAGDADGFANDGWTQIAMTAHTSAACKIVCYAKKMTTSIGSETGMDINWNGATRSAWHCYRISGGNAFTAATLVEGTSTAPDSGSLTPSWGSAKTLWITAYGCDDQNGDVSAYPTNYTTNGIYDEFAASNGVGLGSSYRTNEASSENPGAFTIANSQEWLALTIGVQPL